MSFYFYTDTLGKEYIVVATGPNTGDTRTIEIERKKGS